MAKVVILGTASAVPDEQHDNTHLAVLGERNAVLIDCAGNPIVRLSRAGVDLELLSDLILTHFHPDHVSGVPLLLMDMWLLGRQRPLNIYGLDYTLDRIERLMDLYEWKAWPNFYPVTFCRLPAEELTPVLSYPDFSIVASPARHIVPTLALRFEFAGGDGGSLAYSCDTEPCPEVIRLSAGADVLIHEVTGTFHGHSTAAQAGQVARQAGVGALYLIHYTPGRDDLESQVSEAASAFGGPVALAEDFMELNF